MNTTDTITPEWLQSEWEPEKVEETEDYHEECRCSGIPNPHRREQIVSGNLNVNGGEVGQEKEGGSDEAIQGDDIPNRP